MRQGYASVEPSLPPAFLFFFPHFPPPAPKVQHDHVQLGPNGRTVSVDAVASVNSLYGLNDRLLTSAEWATNLWRGLEYVFVLRSQLQSGMAVIETGPTT